VRLAVGVDETGGGAFDDEARAAEAADARAGVEAAEEKSGGECGGAEEADGLDGDEVERAVVHAGTGGDAGVVAVLVGVGDGNEEDVEGFAMLTGRERDALGRRRGRCSRRPGGRAA
jgi:hypothetical protein